MPSNQKHKSNQRFKEFLGSAVLCFLVFESAVAQNTESVFSQGYDSYVYDFTELNDNKWVVATHETAPQGIFYSDTLSLWILDSAAQVLNTITISPLEWRERFEVGQILALPDSLFIVSYLGGACDVGGEYIYLIKYNTDGDVLWHIRLPGALRPIAFGMGLDSNILIASYQNITKISSLNADIMWQVPHYMLDAIFIPGSEDIIVRDENGLTYLKQVLIQGIVDYNLIASNPNYIDYGYFKIGDNGIVYARRYTGEIIKFRSDIKPDTVLITDYRLKDMSALSNGFAVLNRDNNTYQLIIYDTLGVQISSYQSQISGIRPRRISSNSQGIIAVGHYNSGGYYNPEYLYTGKSQSWFRNFSQFILEDQPLEVSIAVTDVVQLDSIYYDSIWNAGYGGYTGYLDEYNGGNFLIKVTNTGNVPVNSYWVNIYFTHHFTPFLCSPRTANQRYFQDRILVPGESEWVEFGDIEAKSQSKLPNQFCFWTSGPNARPDFVPDDDLFCIDRIVNTSDQSKTSFNIYPNPVNKELIIDFGNNEIHIREWKIIDVFGRTIKIGEINSHSEIEIIEITHIPSGMYYFISGNFSKEFMIQH